MKKEYDEEDEFEIALRQNDVDKPLIACDESYIGCKFKCCKSRAI